MGTVKEIFETLKNDVIVVKGQKYYGGEDLIKQEAEYFDVIKYLWPKPGRDFSLNKVVYSYPEEDLFYYQVVADEIKDVIYFRVENLNDDQIEELAVRFIELERTKEE